MPTRTESRRSKAPIGASSSEVVTSRNSESSAPLDDFRRLVGELIEHVPSAMFAIDGAGHLFQANARFESILGVPRSEFLGVSVADELVEESTRERVRRDLDLVRSGDVDSITLVFETPNDTRVEAECDVRRFGKSDASPWLVTVLRSRVRQSTRPAQPYDALAYDVVEESDGSLAMDGGEHAGKACHAVLYRRDRPCDRCPAFESIATKRQVETAWVDETSGEVHVVRARPRGTMRAHCERLLLSNATIDQIMRSRIESRIERAGLSPRERDVLAYLRLGRSIEDISSLLAISQHTVKFHTANLLQKLGAESRLDLIRILG